MKRLVIGLLALSCAGMASAQTNTVYGNQAAVNEQYNANISVFGDHALWACTYCYGSTAIGANSMRVSSGNYNTAVGLNTMYNATSGSSNTAVGYNALYNLGIGYSNVGIGYNAGAGATVNGSNNVWISNSGLAKDDAVIRIGTQGVQKFTQIAGIYGVKLNATLGGQALYVNSKGQIGVLSTAIVHSAAPSPTSLSSTATLNDVLTLRNDLVATKNMVYSLQREVAQLRATKAVK